MDTYARVWVPQPDDYNALAERIASAHRRRDTHVIVYKNNVPFDEIIDLMGEHHLDFTEHGHDDYRVQAARSVC